MVTNVGRAGAIEQNNKNRRTKNNNNNSVYKTKETTTTTTTTRFKGSEEPAPPINESKHPKLKVEFDSNDLFNIPVPCFKGADIQVPLPEEVKNVSKSLVAYAELLIEMNEPLYMKSFRFVDTKWKSSQKNDICVNPLQIARAWGLLSNLAVGKTYNDLSRHLGKIVRDSSCRSADDWNKFLLKFHVDIEEDVNGCVRLFTELLRPLTMKSNDVLTDCTVYYGGSSNRAAINHLCFGADPDGLNSIHHINNEIRLSTKNEVIYVVPENYAPNWRAQMGLVSASSCTFYWKTEGSVVNVDSISFTNDKGENAFASGYFATSEIWVSPDETCYCLPSIFEDVKLFLKRKKGTTGLKGIQAFYDITENFTAWKNLQAAKVLIPKCVISVPISLKNVTKKLGLNRIFCNEKSELTKLHKTEFGNTSSFITLWDHWHKTVFQIDVKIPVASTNDKKNKHLMIPEKAHILREKCVEEIEKTNKRETRTSSEAPFMYYEEHLERDVAKFSNGNSPDKKPFQITDGTIAFDSTFEFIMVRNCDTTRMVLCCGYFNNTPFVKEEEVPAKTSSAPNAKPDQNPAFDKKVDAVG